MKVTLHLFQQQLIAWKRQNSQETDELFNDAAQRIFSCFKCEFLDLELSSFNLRSLPEILPPWLQHLNISNNKFEELPQKLPASLEELIADDNDISHFSEHLPQTLRILSLSNNNLKSLPKCLPSSLRELIVRNNKLNDLPDNLPECLEVLDASGNNIKNFPKTIPSSLQQLFLSTNNLTFLPDNLPPLLQEMYLKENLLTALPWNLPPLLKILCVSSNKLESLPETWPSSLQELYLSDNFLTTLPENLPNSLQHLNSKNNNLYTLPEKLPHYLRTLNVSSNNLTVLPEKLPVWLKKLYVQNNDLVTLPNVLPNILKKLNASKNNLRTLPDELPFYLQELNVSENNLHVIPDMLPDSLIKLYANHNSIIRFPRSLPPKIAEIDLSHNLLRNFFPSVHATPQNVIINIQNNPLTTMSINLIRHQMRILNHRMSRISFTSSHSDTLPSSHILLNEIEVWFGVCNINWYTISEEIGASHFSRFLCRLRNSINNKNINFKNEVIAWLAQISELSASKKDLRKRIFLIAEDAVASCEDRVLWSYNQMKILCIANDVENGEFDFRLPALINMACGMFRLNILEQIARKKTSRFHGIDEIETYLVYQLMLRERLALPVNVASMIFPNLSSVSGLDLTLAVAEVVKKEKEEFLDFLSIDWKPWKEVLKRHDAKGFEEADNKVKDETFFNNNFELRKKQYLEESGLSTIDIDIDIQLGMEVHRSIERKVWRELTKTFLENHGLKFVIDKYC